MTNSYLFTSESVSEGHPDKVSDQISDAILDAIIEKDKKARVACETLVKTGMVVVAGEIFTNVSIDVENIVRETILDIGYDHSDLGFDGVSCAVLNALGKQSSDIRQGVDKEDPESQGAGDQGLMFGYATNETDVLMPAPIYYSHLLVRQQAKIRKEGKLPWLRPDAKSQVTFIYEDDKPVGIDAVVVSTQHSEDIGLSELREATIEEIINPILPKEWISKDTQYHINPTGRFVTGGPMGDCGLTGRKIIVDTYGGAAPHGGGAFSGKDPTKVDRSAAYAARYIAKNVVSSKIAEKCLIQLAYAIGVSKPLSIYVDLFDSDLDKNSFVVEKIKENFDLSPRGIREMLNLNKPIYEKTAAYGHFGRMPEENGSFSWEKTDKINVFSK